MTMRWPAELDELSRIVQQISTRAAVDDPSRYLREFCGVDTGTLRRVGEEVWGIAGRPGALAGDLREMADRLSIELLTSVQDRWEGPAYDQFDAYLQVVTSAMGEEADQLPVVGEALAAVADAFEVQWYEVVGWVLTVIGLIVSVVGLVTSLLTVETVVGSIVGLLTSVVGALVSAAGAVITLCSSVIPRWSALNSASDRITGRTGISSEVDHLGAGAVPGPLADGIASWQPKTIDPLT